MTPVMPASAMAETQQIAAIRQRERRYSAKSTGSKALFIRARPIGWSRRQTPPEQGSYGSQELLNRDVGGIGAGNAPDLDLERYGVARRNLRNCGVELID